MFIVYLVVPFWTRSSDVLLCESLVFFSVGPRSEVSSAPPFFFRGKELKREWTENGEFDVGKYPPVDVFRVSSSNLAILEFRDIKKKLFHEWNMKLLPCDRLNFQLVEKLYSTKFETNKYSSSRRSSFVFSFSFVFSDI